MPERFETPYEGYDVLEKWDSPSWNDITRQVVWKRLREVPRRQFLEQDEWETLEAAAAALSQAAAPAERLRSGTGARVRKDGHPVDPDPRVRPVFQEYEERTGAVPNLIRALARDPDTLEAFLPLLRRVHGVSRIGGGCPRRRGSLITTGCSVILWRSGRTPPARADDGVTRGGIMRLRTFILPVGLMLGAFPLAACGGGQAASVQEVQAAEAEGMQRVSFRSNPYCGGCVATIKAQLEAVGVQAITADLETNVFTGYYDPEKVTTEQIRAAVVEVGYTVEELKTGEQAA
jgi:copper chaperone CopZ